MRQALQFDVILFGDSVDAGVHFRAAGEGDCDFLTQEEVRVLAQLLGRIDGVVIGYRN